MTQKKLMKYLKLAQRYNISGARSASHLESMVRSYLLKNKRLKKMYSKFLKEE